MFLRKSVKWKVEGFCLLFGNLVVFLGDEMVRFILSVDVEFYIFYNYFWVKFLLNVK